MQDNDNPEHDDSAPTTDAWWAALVADLLHPVQVQIIEAFRYIDSPLTVRDISEIVDDVEPVHLDHHLGRLRKLRALDCRSGQPGTGFMGVRYQLAGSRDRRGAGRSPLDVAFGKKLRACRTRIGISQEELGFRTSLHRTEIGLLERGLREPRLNTIIKLAGALEVPLGELFSGFDWNAEEGFVLPGLGDVPVE
jgi:DNA-binding XRE family transcriptional regulator